MSNPSGQFEVRGQELDLQEQHLSAVHATGLLKDRVLQVKDLSIDLTPDQVIQAKGYLGLDQRFDFQLSSRDLNLNLIQALQGAYPVSGLLDLAIQGTGSIAAPHITADVAVRHPMLGDQPFKDFHLQAKLMEKRLWLDGKMNFDLTADCDLASGDFSMGAHFGNTDLSPLISLLAAPAGRGGSPAM